MPAVRQLGERPGQGVVDDDDLVLRVVDHVDHLLGIPWHGNAPRLPSPAEAEVLEPALDEAPRLVVTELRQHEVRPLVVEAEQALLEGRQPEEPVAFLDPLRRDAVLRAQPVDELRLRLESLTADAVQTGVDVLIDVAGVVDPLDEVLDERLVLFIGRANEEVG